jgi:hypothetical protein
MWHIEPEEVELSTVKTFYVNGGVIGISPNSDRLSHGYDGDISTEKWTRAEKKELAQFMIKLWKKWGGIK